MNLTKEEYNDLYSCPICYSEYNLTTHVPKDLGCGHSLCSSCVTDMHRATRFPKCSFCKSDILYGKEVPNNYALLHIIERREKAKANMCSIHKKYEYDYYCFKDKVKICIACKISDAHKDHDIRALDEINDEALAQAKKSAEMLEKFDRHEKDIQKLYNKVMQKIETQIQNQFTSIEDKVRTNKKLFLAWVKNIFNAKMSKEENLESSRKKVKLEEKISILKRGQINDEFITHLQNEEPSLQLQSFESEIKTTEDQCNLLSNHLTTKLDDLKNSIFAGLDQFEPISVKVELSQANSIMEEWNLHDQTNLSNLPQTDSNSADCEEKIYMRKVGGFGIEGEKYHVHIWKKKWSKSFKAFP